MFHSITNRLFVCMLCMGVVASVARPALAQTERMTVVGKRSVVTPTPLRKTVINSEQIRDYGYRDINELLADVPGLSVATSGGRNGQTSVFMRGAESDHVLVIIDGVRVGDPASGNRAVFESLRPENLARVVVERGPQSARYGSGAIGGVIRIETKQGTATSRVTARIEAASDNEAAGHLGVSGTHRALDYFIGADYRRADGDSVTPSRLRGIAKDEEDGWRNLNMNARIGWDLATLGRLTFILGGVDSRTEYDAPVAPFEAEGYYSDSDERRMAIAYEGGHIGFARPYARVSRYQRLRHETSPFGKDRYRGERVRYEAGGEFLFGEKMTFSLGYENELETASARSAFGGLYGTTRKKSMVTHGEYDWTENTLLSAAWRHDDIEGYGGEVSSQFGISHRFPEWNTKIDINYATAFKAPNEDERLGFAGNPDLEAEQARGWDVGVDKTMGDCAMGLAYFSLRTRDLIEYNFATMLLENVARARSEGIESYLGCAMGEAWDARVDWTLMRATDNEHRRLARRPIRKLDTVMNWRVTPDWRLALRVNYVGPRGDVARDTFARVRRGGYTLTHLNLRRRLTEELETYLRVGNLFDKRYEAVDGYAGERLALHFGITATL